MEATLLTGWIYDHLLPHASALKVAHPLVPRAIAAAKKKNERILSECDVPCQDAIAQIWETHPASVPIRPLYWFRNSDARSGNNAGTLRVPLRSFTCFGVPSDARKSLKLQIKVLCHGRGREFESRRPRYSFHAVA
jgi:hypothetical protein